MSFAARTLFARSRGCSSVRLYAFTAAIGLYMPGGCTGSLPTEVGTLTSFLNWKAISETDSDSTGDNIPTSHVTELNISESMVTQPIPALFTCKSPLIL
ncbi:hypothetical protein MLD38_010870 [Melastoma candidum]|uniref:Uncharacterized protein n=1 Tax=Melastoma candidum TaxID=119954 RepID=A0ACB9R9K0_9MYRT|nr:hypothetical protein MLD38_010870 [Melastoma candidum]